MSGEVGSSGHRVSSPPVVTTVVVAGTGVRLRRLRQWLADVDVEVIGEARNVDEGVTLVTALGPDTLLVDLAIDAGGRELVERVMSRRPTPIVLSGAAAESAGALLAAGAVDVVDRDRLAPGSSTYARELGRHLHVASRVRVITHPRARLRERGLTAGSDSRLGRGRPCVVAIGASTGGPAALAMVLSELPDDLDAAVVVVQHMAEGFVEGLAQWLDGISSLPVSVALTGDRLRPGHVVLAPSDGNLVVDSSLRLLVETPGVEQFHLPGIDRTFTSIAQSCRDRAIGVLLTGMGRDGAAGLVALRRAGALTIAQDEATSVVWGMPGAAAALDAVDLELPLSDIARGVVDAVERLRVAAAV